MENFQLLGLHESLLHALTSMKYEVPTPIQAQTIPAALEGRDVLGTAQTGTGKTAAYGIPLISYLLSSTDNTALVLTPTRELAVQVLALLEQMLGKKGNIRTALIIGGDPMSKQLNQLSSNPRLIVGTPGRINDHLDRGTLKLDIAKFLVLDETDRMLDMGFGIQLDQIVKSLPHKRQTLMFSATLPNNIQSMASKYLKDAIRVSVGSTIAAADTIKQEIIRTIEAEKHDVLLEQLDLRTGSCIIFVKTKMATEKLAYKLREHGHSADAIHGDLRQRNRDKVIRGFRSKKYRILVATDVAARGLDIPHLEHVVNYDLPQCEEDFIHRIGRTGRAGVEGSAVSLITPQDHLKWRNICKMMNPDVKLDSSFDSPKGSDRSKNNRRPSQSNRFRSERSPMRTEGSNRRSEGESAFPRSERRSDKPGYPRSDKPAYPRSNNSSFGRSEDSAFPRLERRSDKPGYPRGDKPAYPRSNNSSFGRSEDSAFPRSERRSDKPGYPRGNNSDSSKRFGNNSNGGSKFKSPTSRGPSSNFAGGPRRGKRPGVA